MSEGIKILEGMAVMAYDPSCPYAAASSFGRDRLEPLEQPSHFLLIDLHKLINESFSFCRLNEPPIRDVS